MTLMVWNDDDVRDGLGPETAVEAVRGALRAQHTGTLHAPPRVRAPLGDGDMVVTAGRLAEQGLFGFRAYDTVAGGDQLVAVWDAATGRLDAVVAGVELGLRRTGAIGAVALDVATRPGPLRVGLVGCGPQAWAQLWAARAVRELREVVVASRSFARAEAFAARARAELGLPVRAVPGVEDAVRGQEAVIVATSSPTPVLDVDWLAPGVHVTTLGPKSVSRHEVPAALAERADVIITDSVVQLTGYPEPHLFAERRVTGLGAALAGAAAGRSGEEQITVFCSVGLAGTEVAVAGALARHLRGRRSRRKVGPPMK